MHPPHPVFTVTPHEHERGVCVCKLALTFEAAATVAEPLDPALPEALRQIRHALAWQLHERIYGDVLKEAQALLRLTDCHLAANRAGHAYADAYTRSRNALLHLLALPAIAPPAPVTPAFV